MAQHHATHTAPFQWQGLPLWHYVSAYGTMVGRCSRMRLLIWLSYQSSEVKKKLFNYNCTFWQYPSMPKNVWSLCPVRPLHRTSTVGHNGRRRALSFMLMFLILVSIILYGWKDNGSDLYYYNDMKSEIPVLTSPLPGHASFAHGLPFHNQKILPQRCQS